jgi:hypothetical protein
MTSYAKRQNIERTKEGHGNQDHLTLVIVDDRVPFIVVAQS